jgi:hypothetical protein
LMIPRTIAIGDIHGCSAALDALIDAIRPRPEDTIVTLGDYINRGPDSNPDFSPGEWNRAALCVIGGTGTTIYGTHPRPPDDHTV